MLRVHLGAIFRPHLNDIKSAFGRYLESHLDVVLVYVWTIFRLRMDDVWVIFKRGLGLFLEET